MRKNVFALMFVSVFLCFVSCISNRAGKRSDARMLVIDKAVIDATQTINEVLPAGSTVVLFNNSTDENELTQFFIEELRSALVNGRNLNVVERDKVDNLAIENRWQMETGLVPDEEIVSIVERLGAHYVISSFITGSDALQRLRVQTWDLRTGETLTSSVFPTNEMGIELAASVAETIQSPNFQGSDFSPTQTITRTIREFGITVDYQIESVNDTIVSEDDYDYVSKGDVFSYVAHSVSFDIYIDGTQYYFVVSLWGELFRDEARGNKISFSHIGMLNTNDRYSWGYMESPDAYSTLLIEYELTSFLNGEGLDRRNVTNIVRIITRIANEVFESKP